MPQLAIDIVAKFAQFQDGLNAIQRQTEGAARKMTASFDGFKRALALGIGGFGAAGFVKQVVDAGKEFEQSQARIRASLRATDNAVGLTADQLEELGKTLSERTRFDDEGLRDATAALLRFRSVSGDTFKEAMKLLPDLAEGLGVGLSEAAQKMGLALQDPVAGLKGLRGAMSKLSDEQADHIARLVEQGKLYEAQRIILEQLRGSVGGLAEELNSGLTKSTKDVDKAWGDFMKTLAKSETVKSAVSGTLNFISTGIKQLDADMSEIAKQQGFFAKAGAAATAFNPFMAGSPQRQKQIQQQIISESVVGVTSPEERAALRAEQDRAAAGAAEEERRKKKADAYAEEQRAIKANVELSKQALATETANQQQASQLQLKALEDGYSDGLIATQNYYEARAKIQQQGLQNEIEDINRLIKAQRAQLSAESTSAEQKPAIQAEIARLEEDRGRKRIQQRALEQEKTRDISQETERLKDVQDEITASLAEQNGELAKADQIRRNIQQRETRKELGKAGAGTADLDALTRAQAAQSEINKLTAQRGRIQEELANRERDIASAVQSGQTDEQAAIDATNAARADSLAQLEAIDREVTRLAAITNNPATMQAARTAVSEEKARAAAISESARAMEDLEAAMRRLSILQAREAIAEQDIQNQRQDGAITTIEAVIKTDKVRQASLEKMRAQLAQEQAALEKAGAAATDEQKVRVEQMRATIDALAASSHQMVDTFKNVFEDSLTQPLDDFIKGTKNAGDAWNDFAKNIGDSLLRLAENQVIEKIAGMLFGNIGKKGGSNAGGGGGGGGADWVGTAVNWVTKFFAAEQGGIMTPYGPLRLQKYRGGGIATGPQLALFGEGRQNEAYVPLPDGRSIPVSMRGGLSPNPQANITFNVSTPDATSFRRSQGQIMADIQQSLARAGSRR